MVWPAVPTPPSAVRAKSKPYLALEVIRAASAKGSPGVPDQMSDAIERVVELARDGL